MTWSYEISNLVASTPNSQMAKDQVRFLIGDTNAKRQKLQDEEVFFALSLRHSIWGATATCAMALSTKYSDLADSTEGPLRVSYSAQARAYAARSVYYETRATALGGGVGYSGGISIADVVQREEDPDRVSPAFDVGFTDNYYPVAPAGNESNPSGNQSIITPEESP